MPVPRQSSYPEPELRKIIMKLLGCDKCGDSLENGFRLYFDGVNRHITCRGCW